VVQGENRAQHLHEVMLNRSIPALPPRSRVCVGPVNGLFWQNESKVRREIGKEYGVRVPHSEGAACSDEAIQVSQQLPA